MTALQHADRIMSLPPGSYIMAAEPVRVFSVTRGCIVVLQPGARIRIWNSTEASTCVEASVFGYTESSAERVSFGVDAAAHFEPVPTAQ